MDARKIITTTAGVAAATGVVVAAAKKLASTRGTSDDDAHVFHITPDGDAWNVSEVGDDGPGKRLETKRQALKEGRKLARRRKPSRLVVHRSDGTIQRQHSYGIDD